MIVNTTADTARAGSGESFEDIVLPHLGAASRLARRLTRSDADADDIVQEASLRALRYFRTFTGGNSRAWFLTIVRNTWKGRRKGVERQVESFDEHHHSEAAATPMPEARLLRRDEAELIERAMRGLPQRYRQLLFLREFEDFSYRELSDTLALPIGTVMSRLARARQALRRALERERDAARGDAAWQPPPRGVSESRQRTTTVPIMPGWMAQ